MGTTHKKVIVRKMESLNLKYPVLNKDRLAELVEAKKILESEIAPHLLIKKPGPGNDKKNDKQGKDKNADKAKKSK